MAHEVGAHDVHAFREVVVQHVDAFVKFLVVVAKVFIAIFNISFHALHAFPQCFLEAPMHFS